MSPASSGVAPWRLRDLAFAVVCTLAGLGLILAAWTRSSDEVRLADNSPWLMLGATGVLLAVCGDSAWILSGRRALQRSRRTLHDIEVVLPDVVVPEMVGDSDEILSLEAIPGRKRFHRPGCLLTAGKETTGASRAEHETAGRLACGACRP